MYTPLALFSKLYEVPYAYSATAHRKTKIEEKKLERTAKNTVIVFFFHPRFFSPIPTPQAKFTTNSFCKTNSLNDFEMVILKRLNCLEFFLTTARKHSRSRV